MRGSGKKGPHPARGTRCACFERPTKQPAQFVARVQAGGQNGGFGLEVAVRCKNRERPMLALNQHQVL
jgi:hypothetical protein